MSAIRTSEAPTPSAYERLRAAIEWAALRRIPVAIGDHGIHLVSRNPPTWEREPNARAISPLAAAVLQAQEERRPLSCEINSALFMAAGANIPWCEGAADGMELADSTEWGKSVAFRWYCAGYEAGVRTRMHLLTIVCAECHTRHGRGDGCPFTEDRN